MMDHGRRRRWPQTDQRTGDVTVTKVLQTAAGRMILPGSIIETWK
jgi:hypothetical protein